MARPVTCSTFVEAVAGIPDGATIIVPGFAGAGMPWNLVTALYEQGARDLTIVINAVGTASTDPRAKSVSELIEAGRVRKVVASFTAATHPSRLTLCEQMIRDGLVEAELVAQGTLAERIRCGGAGIPAFYTPAGVGTLLSEGKEHRDFEGVTYVLEHAIVADYAFVRAWKADEAGNLLFRHSARNYNPLAAMAAQHTIVEVEEPIVPTGAFAPDEIHTSGVWVQRLVQIPVDGVRHVAREVPAPRPAASEAPAEAAPTPVAGGKRRLTRDEMAAIIARRFQPGWLVNLGVGIPTQASNYVHPDGLVTFTSENGVIGYSRLASAHDSDPDIVNAGGQSVTLVPGAAFVHHADSFALIRSGRVDVSVLGAYEAAADGSFANWRLSQAPFDHLGGIGGAMDLVAGAREIWLAMEHTTREGAPRLLEHCTLPPTATRGVTLIVTDLGVIAVRDGGFVLEEHAPGHTLEEIASLTGAPLTASPELRPAF